MKPTPYLFITGLARSLVACSAQVSAKPPASPAAAVQADLNFGDVYQVH